MRWETLAVVLGGLLWLTGACSAAETPDAFFDGGEFAGGADAGATGGADEPCINGRECLGTSLRCIRQGEDGNASLFCRRRCELPDAEDSCGERSRCASVTAPDAGANDGVCLPAGKLDDPCPCDEGFACAILNSAEVCKLSCTIDVDAGTDNCPSAQECVRFTGSVDQGVCVDS